MSLGTLRPRRFAPLFAAAAMCGLAAACPPAALASTGGTAAPVPDEPGDPNVRLSSKRVAYVGRALLIRGSADGAPGRSVRIEARDAAGTWLPVAAVETDRAGRFSTRWRPDAPGRFTMRAVVEGASRTSTGGADPRTSSTRSLTVYRLAMATWYGPGFYGKRTACGTTLTPDTLGVAHRRLACGSSVSIAYRGRTITVPVIDRGPYVRGIEWDLTSATAQRIGFRSTSLIGTIAVTPGR